MPSHRTPLSFRYIKARLRILKRPQVWGAGTALMLLGLFSIDYWSHPDHYKLSIPNRNLPSANSQGQTGLDAPLSPEGRAIGVELDSLPVLLNELQQTDNNQGNQTSENPNPSTTTLPSVLVPSTVASPASSAAQGAEGDALSLLTTPALLATTQPSGLTPARDRSPADPNSFMVSDRLSPSPSPAVPPNQLRNALERYATVAPTASSQPTSAYPSSTREAAGSAEEPEAVPQPLLQQPLPGQQPIRVAPESLSSGNPYRPQTSPPPGTTGYTLPPSLNLTPQQANPSNAYTNLVRPQPVSGVPGAGQPQIGQSAYSNGYGSGSSLPNIEPQPIQPQPVPFSAPRPVPGRSIGNGEINTFSNP